MTKEGKSKDRGKGQKREGMDIIIQGLEEGEESE